MKETNTGSMAAVKCK